MVYMGVAVQVCAGDAAGGGVVAMAVLAGHPGLLRAPGGWGAAVRRPGAAFGAPLRYLAHRRARAHLRPRRQFLRHHHHGRLAHHLSCGFCQINTTIMVGMRSMAPLE